jgi:hypothetical protein
MPFSPRPTSVVRRRRDAQLRNSPSFPSPDHAISILIFTHLPTQPLLVILPHIRNHPMISKEIYNVHSGDISGSYFHKSLQIISQNIFRQLRVLQHFFGWFTSCGRSMVQFEWNSFILFLIPNIDILLTIFEFFNHCHPDLSMMMIETVQLLLVKTHFQ